MEKDVKWERFFTQNHRYADIINGIGCKGFSIVQESDLQDDDTKSGAKNRDGLRKVAFGTNFAIIGIESQEEMDYRMPLRIMAYDLRRYEKQAARIYRHVRENRNGLTNGEYLYGFKKESKLHPEVTFFLYCGEEPWDGATSLHEILNFENIPKEIREMVSDYRIHVVDVRRLEDTSVFKTDVKQVFDFLRTCEDKEKLVNLLETDASFHELENDTVDLLTQYANSKNLKELLETKKYMEGERTDMCKGLRDVIQIYHIPIG